MIEIVFFLISLNVNDYILSICIENSEDEIVHSESEDLSEESEAPEDILNGGREQYPYEQSDDTQVLSENRVGDHRDDENQSNIIYNTKLKKKSSVFNRSINYFIALRNKTPYSTRKITSIQLAALNYLVWYI